MLLVVPFILGGQGQLVNNYQNAGTYEVTWNGKNDSGVQVASGTYIYRIEAGNYVQVRKLILLR